jgi:hypothetical protein
MDQHDETRAAKESAAHSALLWMANQGYDVAYAVGAQFLLLFDGTSIRD